MKKLFLYASALAVLSSAYSCQKDNYSPPSLFLTGHLLYNSDTIQLERNQVPVQIYQYGFGKVGPVSETFAQDGSYSAVLFSGDYKLVIPNGQGPFMWKQTAAGNPDTLEVNLSSNQTADFQVTPFYMIRNAQITGSGTTGVTATCSVEKIITDANAKDIEKISLYVNKTQFVSGLDNIASVDMNGSDITDPASISLSAQVPTSATTQNYYYARIGLKLVGVEDKIYSPLVKVQF